MRRWLVGSWEPGRRGGDPRLGEALAPHRFHTFRAGPLEVAYTGPEAEGGEVLCLLDGHLDDAAELRAELGGEASPARSEEELLARAYRRWGMDLLPRLRGDFLLFVWDRGRRRGLLARDQLGVRPAFLHGGAGGPLRFAGEIEPLLALLPSRPGPDPASLAHWIAASTRPGLATLFAGVRRLGPGCALALSEDGRREERYWAPRFEGTLDDSPPELALRVREGLDRAVRRRSGNGPVAVLLSGGLDSSAVAALGAGAQGEELIACSACFPDHPATDESALIAELRATLGLHGPQASVRPGGLLRSMLAHLRAWGMPPLGWGDFWAEELIAAAAREGASTVLDGDGGDEVFGPRSYLLADRLRAGRPLRALSLARGLPGAGPHVRRRQVAGVYWRQAVRGAIPEPLQRPFRSLGIRREAPAWMLPSARRALAESDDPHAWKRLDGPRWWAHAAHGISYGIEQTGLFEHQRRRAGAHGVEARHPMLDLDLVELCLRQPPRATLDPRFNRPVLRSAMDGLLPDSVRLRPSKAWFDSLIVDCLSGADGEVVRELLSDPAAELGAYVDLEAMRRTLIERPGASREDPFRWMWQVWRLLTAECWLRAQTRSESQILPPSALLSKARVELAANADSYLFHPSP
jgi:asparagine synthase (glutamine-hydrolysing)